MLRLLHSLQKQLKWLIQSSETELTWSWTVRRTSGWSARRWHTSSPVRKRGISTRPHANWDPCPLQMSRQGRVRFHSFHRADRLSLWKSSCREYHSAVSKKLHSFLHHTCHAATSSSRLPLKRARKLETLATTSKPAIPYLDARFHKRPLETHISGMTAHQNQWQHASIQPSHSPSGRSIPRGTIGSFTNIEVIVWKRFPECGRSSMRSSNQRCEIKRPLVICNTQAHTRAKRGTCKPTDTDRCESVLQTPKNMKVKIQSLIRWYNVYNAFPEVDSVQMRKPPTWYVIAPVLVVSTGLRIGLSIEDPYHLAGPSLGALLPIIQTYPKPAP